jgi:hypothetical protein
VSYRVQLLGERGIGGGTWPDLEERAAGFLADDPDDHPIGRFETTAECVVSGGDLAQGGAQSVGRQGSTDVDGVSDRVEPRRRVHLRRHVEVSFDGRRSAARGSQGALPSQRTAGTIVSKG